ncbi:hypothetical protein SAMN05428952_10932 [Nitrosomonas sp. Nm132]|nr:hypothetical protein SAMN05428952_10932 [Nitrosomonas sp. Nm132]
MYSTLYNIYWHIRAARNLSIKRKYYRLAAGEKKRLVLAGVDREELRLLCRHLANPCNRFSERSLIAYKEHLQKMKFSV